MDADIVLQAVNLEKSFAGPRGKIIVLNGLNLSVRRGEVVAIVGASGAGKSTLLQILGSLDRADRGTLRILGREIGAMGARELNTLRNRTLGFVFQFHFLLPEFTALENVAMPGLIGNGNPAAVTARAEALLHRVGLRDRLHHKPGELSGGEQQRVAVARALANGPDVVLADEPTGNLDGASSDSLHELIKEFSREENKTFVVVTHKAEFSRFADRVAVLEGGVLREDT